MFPDVHATRRQEEALSEGGSSPSPPAKSGRSKIGLIGGGGIEPASAVDLCHQLR
jgi:hypothetical protein